MNLGEVLATGRTTARLSLEDLAALTSIRPGLLSEMERNNFSHCGGDIYARGHLRNIAPKIGLDPSRLVELYNDEHSAQSGSVNELLNENNLATLPREKKNLSWKVPAAFSVAIILTVGLVQIVISNVNSSPKSSITAPASPSASASPTTSPTTSQGSSPTESSTVSAIGGGVELTITASKGNSLIDIVINGTHVFKGSLFQGESKSFASDSSISIYLSNPAGVDVIVNGETLPPLGGQNEEVRRTFR